MINKLLTSKKKKRVWFVYLILTLVKGIKFDLVVRGLRSGSGSLVLLGLGSGCVAKGSGLWGKRLGNISGLWI